MFNVYVIENCNMLIVQNLRTLMFTTSWIVTNILDLMNPCESMMNLSLSLSPNPFTICYHLFNHVQNWHAMFLAFETSSFFSFLKGHSWMPSWGPSIQGTRCLFWGSIHGYGLISLWKAPGGFGQTLGENHLRKMLHNGLSFPQASR